MVGVMEGVMVVAFSLFFGAFSGLPIATPPLPPDQVIERAAADSCLFYFGSAGLARPEATSKNLTEQLLADAEVREFLGQTVTQTTRLLEQSAEAPPETNAAIRTLIEAALTRPLAISIEQFTPPSPDGPPSVVASLVLRTGKQNDAIEKAVDFLADQALGADAGSDTVQVKGATLRQLATPLGPLSWGAVPSIDKDGTYVVAIGPRAIESLMTRLADTTRKTPAWKADLEKRMPVERRSTLVAFNAAEALQIMRSLPVPDREKLLAVLDASGIATLETVSASTGMTAEGVSSRLWLRFDGKPRGLFAAPAKGIEQRIFSRVPADAIMAQAWSLDLSKSLAMVLDMVAAGDPDAAEEMRDGLLKFRAAAGFDVDTHLLKTLGPDWTILSVPTPGGIMPGIAVIAGIRDRPTFATMHKVLIKMVQAATAENDVKLSVRQIPYRGQTLFCLEASGEEMAFPVTPTWCLTDDSLIVTISPQFMKTLLSRDPSDRGIGSLPSVTKAVTAGEPSLVGVTDPVWIVGSLCGLYEIAVPVARGALRNQGIDIDLPQLPAASAIMPYVRPSVTVVRHEADGIMVESTGTVPLGPLSAGGGVLGVSPVATPVLVGLLLPAVQSAREAARRATVMNNFSMVMRAMHMSEAMTGRMPSQAICDKGDKPLLSWRVAMLPYLDEGTLYEKFRLDESWDSEHNLKLVGRMPDVFKAPDATAEQIREGLTTVQVITGPGTVFATPSKGIRVSEVNDGMGYTLAVVEALPENAVPWTKPVDITFDAKKPLAGVGNPQRQGGMFVAAFLDGHVQVLTPDIPAETFKAIVTPSGGEVVELP